MRAVTIDSDLATLFTFTPRKPPITPIEGVYQRDIFATFRTNLAPNQLKLSTRRPSSGRCRPQTTSASNDVPRLAAPLLRPTTCPTPSRGRKEEARATTSGTRGRRACGGTTSRTNRTSAERRVSRAPAAATPPPSAADGGRESTRRGATRPSPSRLPPAAPRGVGCTALRDGPGGGERPLPPAWRTISPVEASL